MSGVLIKGIKMRRYDSQNKLYQNLHIADFNKRTYKGKYQTTCAACKRDFEFNGSDIKDKVIKCPYCRYDNIFFYYDYK